MDLSGAHIPPVSDFDPRMVGVALHIAILFYWSSAIIENWHVSVVDSWILHINNLSGAWILCIRQSIWCWEDQRSLPTSSNKWLLAFPGVEPRPNSISHMACEPFLVSPDVSIELDLKSQRSCFINWSERNLSFQAWELSPLLIVSLDPIIMLRLVGDIYVFYVWNMF